jgi:hypothetical protein
MAPLFFHIELPKIGTKGWVFHTQLTKNRGSFFENLVLVSFLGLGLKTKI